MAKLIFQRMNNPDIVSYTIIGITSEGKRATLGSVANPTKPNPVLKTFTLSGADLLENNTYTVYAIKYTNVLAEQPISVTYDNTPVDAKNIQFDSKNNFLIINETISKTTLVDVSLYLDAIEFEYDKAMYPGYVISPVINIQGTTLGYHSKLV